MKDKNSKLWSQNFLNDFKHWVEESEKTGEILKGHDVKAKGTLQQILEKIDCIFQKHTEKLVARSFLIHGGVVKVVYDDLFLIKTKRGKFFIKKEFAEEA